MRDILTASMTQGGGTSHYRDINASASASNMSGLTEDDSGTSGSEMRRVCISLLFSLYLISSLLTYLTSSQVSYLPEITAGRPGGDETA